MAGALLGLAFTGILSFVAIQWFYNRYPSLQPRLLVGLYFYHLLLSLAYYLYAMSNPSDSHAYYSKVVYGFRGHSWLDYYGTSTTFIEFIGYPFIKYLGFNYEGMMLIFSCFGFLGFCYLYVLLQERIRFRHTFLGYNLILIVLFLPNLHFWSSSFGKGSLIFLGITMFFFGVSKLQSRWVITTISSLIIYHVRPHVFLIVLIASIAGFVFTTKQTSVIQRVIFLLIAGMVLSVIYADVMALVGLEEDTFTEGTNLSQRATELTKATSGIDIQNYNFFEKMFAFLYRPLFFDAPGVLGLIVSFENLFYLIITFKILNPKGLQFLLTSDYLSKAAMISFLLVSFALAQISGNLGLAMRQKSQVMPLFMFVILYFLDQQKYIHYKKAWQRRHRKWRASQLRTEV